MKRTVIITTATTVLAMHLSAQGQFDFQARTFTGLIQYSTDDHTVALYPLNPGLPEWGNAHVGFYTAPNGTVLTLGPNGIPDFTGWTANTLVMNVATGIGKTAAATVTVLNAANDVNVELEVVGWTGTATSWAQAVGSAGPTTLLAWSGKVFPGSGNALGAFGWSQPTFDPNDALPNVPAALVTGAAGFNGLVFAVPEPSAVALIGLGISTTIVMLSSRRKTPRRSA